MEEANNLARSVEKMVVDERLLFTRNKNAREQIRIRIVYLDSLPQPAMPYLDIRFFKKNESGKYIPTLNGIRISKYFARHLQGYIDVF